MSAFHRFVFSTFLLLALGCFAASSAFASPHVYYKFGNNQCSFNKTDACASALQALNTQFAPYAITYTNLGCTGYDPELSWRRQRYNYEAQNYYDISEGVSGAGQGFTVECDGQLTLNADCSTTCGDDPCKNLKDQEFSGLSVCGSFSCSDGGVIQGGSCSRGKMLQSIGSPDQNLINDQCIGTFDRPNLTTRFYNKTDDEGKSSGSAYCSAFYKYNGLSATDTVADLNLAALSAANAVPLPASGVCPADKPLKSKIGDVDVCIDNKLPDSPCPVAGEKPNSNGVCVSPDDPTYPKDNDPTKPDPKTSCDAGEIRNNSGKCVPYADATKCEAGQVRDNLGLCSADPKANSCPQGTVKNKTTGACSADPRGTGCPNNQLPDKLGMCPDGSASCAVGKIRNASGACVGSDPTKPPEGTGCKDGSTPNSSGVCNDGSASCPVGKVRGSDGKCALDTTESNTTGTASSDCEVAPDCGGDPLQCATLEQIWRSSCEQTKAFSEISKEDAEKMSSAATASQAEYDAHQAAVDAQASGFFSEFESKASSVSSSGQCINDLSVPVMGHSMTIPFSQACDFFRFLRILVLFSAYMLAARIIFGGLT